jgi:hypothetical protein
MIYAPFSLTDAVAAELAFDWWSDTEYWYDAFFGRASTDLEDYYGTIVTGNWASWTAGELLDLSDLPILGNLLGRDQVWIAFVFGSDYSITDRGSFAGQRFAAQVDRRRCEQERKAYIASAHSAARQDVGVRQHPAEPVRSKTNGFQ